jgi:GR25 family glycosyltransferase involved in LPS biosynthesis
MKTVVISLPNAKERQEKIKINFLNKNINYEMSNGVSPKDIVFLKNLSGFYFNDMLFKINDKNLIKHTNRNWFRFGEIANVLAHYKVCKTLLNDENNSYFLICEDDCIPSINFDLNHFNKFNFNETGFIYLQATTAHYQDKKILINQLPYCKTNNNLKEITKHKNFICEGTAAYIISKNYCQMLCDYIENNGYDGPIDNLICRLDNFTLYCPVDIENYFFLDDTSKFSYTHDGTFVSKYHNGTLELQSTCELIFKE